MSADRKLLEDAAKAAGVDAEFHTELGYGTEGMWLKGARSPGNHKYWNPLTDDGDALRLAVKLGMNVDIGTTPVTSTEASVIRDDKRIGAEEYHNADPYAATRRAIVRAAAAIGAAK